MNALHAYCKAGNHYPAILLAHIPDDLDPDGLGVQCDNAGEPLNLWADGTRGVPFAVREWAALDEEPICAEHFDYINWEHGERQHSEVSA